MGERIDVDEASRESWHLRPSISWAIAIILSALHWIIAVSASRHNSITFDEIAHISGGLSSVQYSDYRLNPENGILPQMLSAAAMYAGGVRLPDVSDPSVRDGSAWLYSDSWELGFRALYELESDAEWGALLGRGAMALCGVLTVLLVHGISRWVHRGNSWGSLVPTLLAAACPTMLAHGAIITSDAFFTLFILASCMSIYAMLYAAADKTANILRLVILSILTGILVGCTVTAKHSGVVVAPLALLLLLLRILLCHRARSFHFVARALLTIAISVPISYVTVWAPFRFRYSAFSHLECRQWKDNWDSGLGNMHGKLKGVPALLVQTAAVYKLLPENLLYGMGYAFLSTHSRASFLAGMHGTRGWRTFFPYAVLVKTPVGVLFLSAVGALAWRYLASGGKQTGDMKTEDGGEEESASMRFSPLAAWALFYTSVAVQQNLNIGHRHMLPVYPCIYVLCGFTWRVFASRDIQSKLDSPLAFLNHPLTFLMRSAMFFLRLVLVFSVMGTLFEVASVFPYYIAFFNVGAGGPANGYRHLVDSSLDWGQGLPALRDFIQKEVQEVNRSKEHGPLIFYVSYFGLGNPTFWNLTRGEADDYQIHHLHSSIAGVSLPKHAKEINPYLVPGYFCIGASMLQPVYNKDAPGNWNAYYENLYRRQTRLMVRMKTIEMGLRTTIFTGQVPELHDMPRILAWIDAYRLGRIGAFLKEDEPYAQPAYAFNVYKVPTRQHLNRLLYGPAPKETSRNDLAHLSISLPWPT